MNYRPPQTTYSTLSFGPFCLSPAERLLTRNGDIHPVGSRALDILMVLVDRRGEVISKKDLLARVWPGLTVDEGGLRVHVTRLRKALDDGRDGARYITNVPGRGYCFVGRVVRDNLAQAS